mmetsp:Transcript_123628/g.355106  ORF Transcript_123628/g.355106 Transcript_123628/m.355106 type:complete len:540 (+) Transcript_123628:2-1621(+)
MARLRRLAPRLHVASCLVQDVVCVLEFHPHEEIHRCRRDRPIGQHAELMQKRHDIVGPKQILRHQICAVREAHPASHDVDVVLHLQRGECQICEAQDVKNCGHSCLVGFEELHRGDFHGFSRPHRDEKVMQVGELDDEEHLLDRPSHDAVGTEGLHIAFVGLLLGLLRDPRRADGGAQLGVAGAEQGLLVAADPGVRAVPSVEDAVGDSKDHTDDEHANLRAVEVVREERDGKGAGGIHQRAPCEHHQDQDNHVHEEPDRVQILRRPPHSAVKHHLTDVAKALPEILPGSEEALLQRHAAGVRPAVEPSAGMLGLTNQPAADHVLRVGLHLDGRRLAAGGGVPLPQDLQQLQPAVATAAVPSDKHVEQHSHADEEVGPEHAPQGVVVHWPTAGVEAGPLVRVPADLVQPGHHQPRYGACAVVASPLRRNIQRPIGTDDRELEKHLREHNAGVEAQERHPEREGDVREGHQRQHDDGDRDRGQHRAVHHELEHRGKADEGHRLRAQGLARQHEEAVPVPVLVQGLVLAADEQQVVDGLAE